QAAMADDDELEEEEETFPRPELDSKWVLDQIMGADATWQDGRPITVGSLRWRPDLLRDEPPAVLHVHGASRIRSYLFERMPGAHIAGYEVHLAADLATLWDEETLQDLGRLDVQVHLIKHGTVASPALVPVLICDERVVLSVNARRTLAEHY